MNNSWDLDNSEVLNNAMPHSAETEMSRINHAKVQRHIILKQWNREWLSLGVTWTQDRRAWAVAIRDVGVAMDTGTTSSG